MPTMRTRLAVAAPLAALALLVAAGCGGSSNSKGGASGSPAGATVIPASAVAYVSINSDLGSDQWKKADALSKKFPGRAKALADFQKALAKQNLDFQKDVKPALGPEIDVAWLDFADGGQNVVAVTQPKDDAKLAALVKKNNTDPSSQKLYTEKVGDWTALAGSQARLDRLKSAQNGAKLADDSTFKDAVADLPGDALVKAYLNGQAARQAIKGSLPSSATTNGFLAGTPLENLQWLSAGAASESKGIRLAIGEKGPGGGKNYSPELVHALPAGAWGYLSFTDLASGLRQGINALKSTPGFEKGRAQVEQALGLSLEQDLLPIFSGEGAVAVYPGAAGSRIPSIDFVVKVSDEAKARHVLQRLVALARLGNIGAVRPVTVAGVSATELRPTGVNVAIDVAVSKGMLVVTNSRSALGAIGGGGKKLADDPLYKSARSDAKAPSQTNSLIYMNLHAALPAILDLAGAYGGSSAGLVQARANTAPLQSILLYSTRNGDVTRGDGFLQIK